MTPKFSKNRNLNALYLLKKLFFYCCMLIAMPFLAFASTNDNCNYSNTTDEDYSEDVATASIGDYVWNDYNRNGKQDSYERGIEDVVVGLYAKGADGDYGTADDVLIDYVTTDEDGLYEFENVPTGEYIITVFDFTMPNDYIFCPMNVGDNPEKDSNIDPETGRSAAFVVSPQMNERSFDIGMASACAGVIPVMTIGYGQVLPAGGTPETLSILYPNIANPEIYEFQWMKKTTYTDWVGIPGATEMTYTPPAVFTDTYYVLCYRIATCSSSDFKESNVLLMEVGNCIAPIVSETLEYCVDEAANFSSGNMSINLSFAWAAEGGVLSNTTGSSTSIVWFEAGDYYVDLTATSSNGCEHTNRKLIHVRECNNYTCCANGQVLASLCYNPTSGSGSVLCSVQVPCSVTDQLLATGDYSCGPCAGVPSCGTGFFLNSADTDIYGAGGLIEPAVIEMDENTTPFSADRDLKVFPNPASEQITLTLDTQYFTAKGEDITIQLFDMQSRLQQQISVRNSTEVESIEIDLRGLADGLYLFKVINGTDEPQVKKFVKMQE